MIELTLLNGQNIIVNCERIETIEERPDTIVTLFGGRKIIVKESAQEVIKKTISYYRTLYKDRLFFNETLPSV